MFAHVRLYLPLGLVLLPWGLAPLLQSADAVQLELARQLPTALAVLAIILACTFKRSRIALATLMFGMTGLLLQRYHAQGLNAAPVYVQFTLLTLLAPIAFGSILLLRDHALFSSHGALRLLLLGLPFLALAALWQWPARTAYWLPHFPPLLLEMAWPGRLLCEAAAWLSLPLLGLALLLTLTRRSADEVALFGAFLAQLLALSTPEYDAHTLLLQGTIPLLLGTAVLLHIYSMAFIDALTGIPSRRALEHQLASLGRHYSIAMLDIDHFKQFNDTYGHDVGDQVLCMVASQLRKVAAGGRLYRYGGEEFTLVFNGKRETEVLAALDQVRQRVEQYPMQVRSPKRPRSDRTGRQSRNARRDSASGLEQVRVTVSIGVAQRQDDEKPAAVIKRADQALYRAKGAGRNCIMGANQPSRARRAASI